MLRIGNLPSSVRLRKARPLVTFGVFDEMHRGQRWLLRRMVARARERATTSAVVLIRPRPPEALGLSSKAYVTPVFEVVRECHEIGIDFVGVLRFSKAMALMEAEQFLCALQQRTSFSELWLGKTATVGRGATGSPVAVRSLGLKMGFSVEYVWTDETDDGPRIYSLLEVGAIEQLSAVRGSPLSVVAGVAEMRTHDGGAFLEVVFPIRQLLPPSGWYKVAVAGTGAESSDRAFLFVRGNDGGNDVSSGILVTRGEDKFKFTLAPCAIRLTFHRRADIDVVKLLAASLDQPEMMRRRQ
jgi:FAD synthase